MNILDATEKKKMKINVAFLGPNITLIKEREKNEPDTNVHKNHMDYCYAL